MEDTKNRPSLNPPTEGQSTNLRTGQVCLRVSNADNCSYTYGKINDAQVNFLWDSGATVSLISKKTYDRCLEQKDLPLIQSSCSIQGVDGANIHVYGHVEADIALGSYTTKAKLIVCDMANQGILGYDFIGKHIRYWDMENMEMLTKDGMSISCYAGRNAGCICRVTVTEHIEIPSRTCSIIPIAISNSDLLPETAYVDCHISQSEKEFGIIGGIIDPHKEELLIGVINKSEYPIQVERGQELGKCFPSLEAAITHNTMIDGEEVTGNPVELIRNVQKVVPDHLKEMFDKSKERLTSVEASQFASLLCKYQDVFARSSDDLGCTDRVKHTINTGAAHPIRQPVRRMPYGKREIERKEVEKMLEKGIIEPSNSPWSSPIVLVGKKDGSTRFCVDYRRLNEVTVKDAYPIPRVDDCFDALSGSKWFNCMDLCSGFWQIEMDDQDKLKTAFSTSQGLYHFRVMPFGLVNAPSTFSRLMQDVLRGLQWVETLLYMDDLITPGKTVDQCLSRLENVFLRLREAKLKLKPSKCIFFQKSVKFLGHVVSEDGVHTDPEKVKAVKEWPIPTSVKEVKSFIGLASYHRRFVKGFADIARPLHKLDDAGTKFSWTEECQKSFDQLKLALTTSPILAYPQL